MEICLAALGYVLKDKEKLGKSERTVNVFQESKDQYAYAIQSHDAFISLLEITVKENL